MINTCKTCIQVVFYILLFLLSVFIVQTLSIPLPANIVGMVILFVAMLTKVIPVRYVRRGSSLLLSEMLLFFIPAVVAIINYFDILENEGIRILVVIVLSTTIVLSATAYIVDKVFKYELRKREKC
ncbi:CidA/LrgA family protein [Rahnella victoriana]|uniref:CidA/LrgA family protein n=1 Tax=Rahnella victoriana TaxID=1510570 RepID=A0ABS0DUR7_9GAMM|nr:CidA/LrgA family protein [Rahnella victoriana]MBF7957375.1 CidA/LrgA family protein [Rahnella victoriana]